MDAIKREAQQKKYLQESIGSSMRSAEAIAADRAIARFFYANAVPFGVAEEGAQSCYKDMVAAIRDVPTGYVPPTRKALGGRLIDDVYLTVKQELKARNEANHCGERFGYTLVQDGWESCDKLPLINSCYICANDGGTFLRSVDCSGK